MQSARFYLPYQTVAFQMSAKLDNIKLRLMLLTDMPHSHGTRVKSRSILTKRNVVRGISYLLYDYKVGDKVVVNVDPREHNTTPHRRFHGRIGVVEEVGRRTLKVSVMIGNKKKILQTRFNHIKLLAGNPAMSQSAAIPPPPPPPSPAAEAAGATNK
jgi:large subunit ribosomal protein L21e